jgi:hypothetical protein
MEFNMAKTRTSRKQLFRAALALADLTAGEWAEREGTSESYLSLVLNEKRESEALTSKIDAFTHKQLEKHLQLAS